MNTGKKRTGTRLLCNVLAHSEKVHKNESRGQTAEVREAVRNLPGQKRRLPFSPEQMRV